jgi:tetratricopeptide (TPR) repeat protein
MSPIATPVSFTPVTHEAGASAMHTDEADEPTTRRITTEIEQLLPLSLPKPPRLPSIDEAQLPAPPRRLPWASMSVFASALAASSISLVHYARHAPLGDAPAAHERALEAIVPSPAAIAASAMPLVAAMPLAPRLEPLPGDERASSPEQQATHSIEQALARTSMPLEEVLFERGLEALAAGDERLAESLFGRLIDRDAKSADGAYGLAQVRITQNDFEAAEGWIRLAIAQRPREPTYRLLHADLLQRAGQPLEAQAERTHARALEKQEPAAR